MNYGDNSFVYTTETSVQTEPVLTALCFDDVQIVPQYSEVESRKNVSLVPRDFSGNEFKIGDRSLPLPIFASPMDTVVDKTTARILAQAGVSPILHRYCLINKQVKTYQYATFKPGAVVGAAIGATGDYFDRATALYNVGCRFFCIDVAHGHHTHVKRALETLRAKWGDEITIMAGNVATLAAFDDLVSWGANFVRSGIAGGKVCTTKVVTGCGLPTLQTVLDCAASETDGYIVADGGIKNSGDIVKSFAAGADFVMLGSLLSCCEESPGDQRVNAAGEYEKLYRGMASASAQKDWRKSVSGDEGMEMWGPSRGNLKDVVANITAGIRSGLSYSGVDDVNDFYSVATLRQVSSNSTKLR